MRVTFEVVLNNHDVPGFASRSASLFRLMADRLDSEASTGSVSSVGQGVQIGRERLSVLEIDRTVNPMNEDK